MKRIYAILIAALVLTMTACGEKENVDNTNTNTPDTTSGATSETLKSGRLGNGNITIADYSYEDVFGADFDNDGVLEFKIDRDFDYISYNWTSGGNNIVNKEGAWDDIDPLDTCVVIGPESRFEGQGDALFTTGTLPALFFVGCRFVMSDGVHYGWIKVKNVDGTLEWEECVYRTTPETSITTGKN